MLSLLDSPGRRLSGEKNALNGPVGREHIMQDNFKKKNQDIASYEYFQKVAAPANINPRTLLATDYLNHFNEVIMLIDMIADMPDCAEDIFDWKPKTYQEHFRDSSFSSKDLAIAAYEYTPLCYREPLERLIGQLNGLILQVVSRLREAASANDGADIAAVALFGPELRLLVERAGGIINGEAEGHDQAEIDAVLRS